MNKLFTAAALLLLATTANAQSSAENQATGITSCIAYWQYMSTNSDTDSQGELAAANSRQLMQYYKDAGFSPVLGKERVAIVYENTYKLLEDVGNTKFKSDLADTCEYVISEVNNVYSEKAE